LLIAAAFWWPCPSLAMANRTDTQADTVHGTNPQYLVDRIVRVKIYNDHYWKEHCFALTAETVIDKAIELDYIGGTYGGRRRPAKFLCLMLKLLQIQPDEDVIMEYIKQPDSKYLRALGAAYLRLTGRAKTVHETLEPLYADYRKLRYREITGKLRIIHMDEWIDWCFHEETIIDITMPQLPKREVLEYSELLEPYVSVLEDDLEDLEELEGAEDGDEAPEERDASPSAGPGPAAPDQALQAEGSDGECSRSKSKTPPREERARSRSAAPASPRRGRTSRSPRRQKEMPPRHRSRDRSRSPRRHKERRARSPSRCARSPSRRARSPSRGERLSVSMSCSRGAREERKEEKAKKGKKEKVEKREKKDVEDKRVKKDKKKKKEERNMSEEREEKAVVEEKPKKVPKEKKKGLWKEERASGKAGQAGGGKKEKDGELSVDGWNAVRAQLGLKPLKG